MPKRNDNSKVVFEVSSKCSGCQSVLRTYDKTAKQTTCYQCGKKQPNPRIGIDSLESYDNPPDLSAIEKSNTPKELQACPSCGSHTLKISDKADILFECATCGKPADDAQP